MLALTAVKLETFGSFTGTCRWMVDGGVWISNSNNNNLIIVISNHNSNIIL